MSPSKIATLKNFLVEQCVEFDIRSSFQHTFWVDPTRGSVPVWTQPLVTEPSIVPSETNSWLHPCIRDDIMTSSVSLYCVQKMTDNNIPWVAVAVGCQQHTPAALSATDVVAETEQHTVHPPWSRNWQLSLTVKTCIPADYQRRRNHVETGAPAPAMLKPLP